MSESSSSQRKTHSVGIIDAGSVGLIHSDAPTSDQEVSGYEVSLERIPSNRRKSSYYDAKNLQLVKCTRQSSDTEILFDKYPRMEDLKPLRVSKCSEKRRKSAAGSESSENFDDDYNSFYVGEKSEISIDKPNDLRSKLKHQSGPPYSEERKQKKCSHRKELLKRGQSSESEDCKDDTKIISAKRPPMFGLTRESLEVIKCAHPDKEETFSNILGQSRKHKKHKKNELERYESRKQQHNNDYNNNRHRTLAKMIESESNPLLKQKYIELDEQNKHLVYYNRRTKHEIEDLKQEKKALLSKLNVELVDELKAEEARAEMLERRLKELVRIFEETSKARAQDIETMKEDLEKATEEYNSLHSENKSLQESCSKLEAKVSELQDTISVRKEHEDMLLTNMNRILMEKSSSLTGSRNSSKSSTRDNSKIFQFKREAFIRNSLAIQEEEEEIAESTRYK